MSEVTGPRKLKPEDKAKWVEALRSGKYRQNKNFLKHRFGGTTSFCCLGVACEIGIAKPNRRLDNLEPVFVENTFLELKLQEALATRNDAGDSFNTIADFIEKYL